MDYAENANGSKIGDVKRVCANPNRRKLFPVDASKRGLCHEDDGFCGGGAPGGRWSFCVVRAALRASIHDAASVSFSETSRKNCAVRFSVSGATSSLTKLFTRASSSSMRLPKFSKFLMRLRLANSSSMRLPNSSNLSISAKSPEKSPRREEARRLGYYRNAVCRVARRRIGASLSVAVARGKMEERDARVFWRRRTTAAAENLPGVRCAGRNQHDALPRVRREPAVFPRSPEQETFRTLRRAGSSRDLRAADRKPSDVRRQLGGTGQ